MPPALPPKTASFNPANLNLLTDALNAVVAGHPGSIALWTFYEVIDNYLGPWGEEGYPIGYGKHYCKLFTENEKLAANPQASDWVKRTMVYLQEALRDFIVEQFRKGHLAAIKEPELRQAAFASHAKAYTDGGLSMVMLVAPEMIPVSDISPMPLAVSKSHGRPGLITKLLATVIAPDVTLVPKVTAYAGSFVIVPVPRALLTLA